ncbi:MAG TPA: hypothetical protein VMF11_07455 [Candidatus Baltobacteraceae bacterium]|nr:hypothetical protein [Candidatus Baltobacteraceae bacterium]
MKSKSFALIAATLVMMVLPAAASPVNPSAQTLMSAMHWRSVGPGIGGRVVAVDGVPGSPDTFYFGGVDGGVWRSTDYGLVWTNLTDGKLNASNSIGAIAVAPSDPRIIYIGTGESDIRGDVVTGDGVFKSTDAGETWRYAGLVRTHTIGKIVVDPHNSSVVYAVSMGHVFKSNPDRGVFKSTDGGATWKKVLFVNDKTGAIDLVMDPHDANVLYAAMWQAYRTPWTLQDGGPGSGLYKTIDGGAHWTNLSRTPGFPKGLLGRIGVTVAASDPRVVYSIVQAKDGGIFRSSNGGASWTRVNDHMELRQRAFYYMAIYADPKDPNTVYVPQVEALWVSRNGGRSFTRLHTPHGDNHIVWVDPRNTNVLLEGNDGGATVSTDGGKTWSGDHNQATGQFYHVALSDDRFPFRIYGAQQDEGSFEGPSASADGIIPTTDWKRTAYGESTFIAPQPGDSKVAYGSGYFSIMLRYDRGIDEYQSVSPWPLYREGASSGELKYRFGWTHPILFSPANPKELLVGSQYVLRSDDEGQTWQKISPDLTRNVATTEAPSGGPIDLDQSSAEIFPDVSALAVSPLDGNVIWAGSADGLVHVTTDGGANWSLVTPPALPQWAEISSIEASHTEKGTAYLSASRYMWDDFHPYVYETTDYGKHWYTITSGLPDDQYVFTVRQDPDDAQLLFATTKSTVYVSLDGAARWQPLTLNLPNVQVRDVAIDTRQGEVVVATHGRSFWALDNLALLEQLTKSSAQHAGGAQLFAPQAAWLTHVYGSSPYGGGTATGNGENPPFGATVFFYVPKSYNGRTPVTLTFRDEKGNLIRRFALHRKPAPRKPREPDERFRPTQEAAKAYERLTAIAPGMNSFQWDLRYADATEVTGFEPPVAAGGLDDTVEGPQVVPGNYTVTLDYGGATATTSFTVALDPRIKLPDDALAARLDLGMKIRSALDTLDRTIDTAIATRERLRAAVAAHKVSAARAAGALAQLDAAIDGVVQLDIHSSEGTLLHEAKLRSYLAYLAAGVDLAYVKPTPAQYAVFDQLSGQATTGEAKLKSATAAGNALL